MIPCDFYENISLIPCLDLDQSFAPQAHLGDFQSPINHPDDRIVRYALLSLTILKFLFYLNCFFVLFRLALSSVEAIPLNLRYRYT